MTWREISVERLNELKNPLLVDVRSPCEHKAESIPGSTNIPLLSDTERAQVGTVYKNEGEVAARRLALKMISPKIPSLVDDILRLRMHGQQLVVHCWRGGLRSEAVASFLAIVGVDCWKLTGGYKAWRQQVLCDFQNDRYQFQAVILHGHTGAGKTEILKCLKQAGHSVLDLEALANHRGSVFGALGLAAQPSQKNFEASLWLHLRSYGSQPVFMEAESRRIGKLAIPDLILKRITSGHRILVNGTTSLRARRIVDDYTSHFDDETRQKALSSLTFLKERLGVKRVAQIQEMALSGSIAAGVQALLLEYYDPLYSRQIAQCKPYDLEVSGDDPLSAAAEITSWCSQKFELATTT